MTITADQNVLIVGGSSGIGHALANKLAESTTPAFNKIFITGRSHATITAAASSHPKLVPLVFDPNDLAGISAFVEKKVKGEGVTYVVLNAGMGSLYDYTKPASVNFELVQSEVSVNLLAPIKFTQALIAAFNSSENEMQATIAVTTSGIALSPFPAAPIYSATKAALRAFVLSVREQLYALPPGENKIKMVEIVPPAIKTAFFTRQKDPSGGTLPAFGADLKEYIDDLVPRLVGGEEEIGYLSAQYRLDTVGKAQWDYLDMTMGRKKMWTP